MPNEIAETPEVAGERFISPFVLLASLVEELVHKSTPVPAWSESAYEIVFRYLMDYTVDHPGVDISDVRLTEVKGSVTVAVKVALRSYERLEHETFRAVLGHLLYGLDHERMVAYEAAMATHGNTQP